MSDELIDNWFTGTGQKIEYQRIINIIDEYTKLGGVLSVGTDSHISKKNCTFSSAICLHGASSRQGGRYFYKKENFKKAQFASFPKRIIFEVQKSIELGMEILQHFPEMDIELHMDISSAEKNNKTSGLANMLIGYASGAGFKYRIKPNAFAAATVADKHSKPR